MGLLRKFYNLLPRNSLLTIYKSFIRPHLDYGDIICDQSYNTSLGKTIFYFFNSFFSYRVAILLIQLFLVTFLIRNFFLCFSQVLRFYVV